MFAWARIPEPYRDMGSIEFATHLVEECDVAVSPGVGFGPGGDEFVRFALIENEHRIGQAVRGLRRGLTRLGWDRPRPHVVAAQHGVGAAVVVDRLPGDVRVRDVGQPQQERRDRLRATGAR